MPKGWCESAPLRKKQIESGQDLTFNLVFKPKFISFFCSEQFASVLEVGAGTGHLAKEIVRYCKSLDAIEPSNGMYKVAMEVLNKSKVNLSNHSLSEHPVLRKYDAIYAHLVTQSIDDLFMFFGSIKNHLNKDALFLFSIPHPCFYNEHKNLFTSEEYLYMKPNAKNVSFTITKDPDNIISEIPYQHRPLSTYINTLSSCDFIIKELEEIYPKYDIQIKYGKIWETPRYCLFTCQII